MPTYEYECEKCGKMFEAFQRMSDEPLKICNDEACKGPVHRLLSGGAGFLLKGSGFYSTDYRSDSYKKAAEKDKSSSSSSSSASSSASKPSSSSSTPSSSSSSAGGTTPAAK